MGSIELIAMTIRAGVPMPSNAMHLCVSALVFVTCVIAKKACSAILIVRQTPFQAALPTQAGCWYGITVQKQHKALATGGAFYFFDHLTLRLKLHPIVGTLNLQITTYT